MSAIVATAPGRQDLVRAVCVREWREALGNKLLVGMTLLPPVVILFTGIAAVAAAAINPPSERDVQALYSAAPAVAGLDPTEAIYLASVAAIGSHAAANAVTAPRWILAIVVMVPLLTLLSVNLGILISTRVNDVRVAQQIGGLVVVPVVGLGIAQVTGRVVLDNGAFVQMTVVLVIIDILVFAFARLSFQRENILVRWR